MDSYFETKNLVKSEQLFWNRRSIRYDLERDRKRQMRVIFEMEKIMRGLFGVMFLGGNKIRWIAWSMVCKSKQGDGLRLGFLHWKNKSLLLKALWRRLICD